MDRYSVFAPRLLPQNEDFVAGLRSCPGCGQALAARIIAKALANLRRYPYGAPKLLMRDSSLPYSAWRLFGGKTLMPSPGAPSGIAVAGETGTLDEGLALCAQARKKKGPFIYICFLNESGIKRHGAPEGSGCYPDRTAGIVQRFETMQACLKKAQTSQCDYFATACPAYPFDLIEKISRARSFGGTAFLGVLTACPTGCLYDPAVGLESVRRAVETGLFPLYEVIKGAATLTVAASLPASRYAQLQPLVPPPDAAELAKLQSLADSNLRSLKPA
jgi:pyruvate ferredoxin oxidoreductase beta subunit